MGILTFILAGLCAFGGGLGAARAETALTIYSGRGEKFTRPVTKAFTDQTGIPVRVQTGQSTALLAKLRVEGDRSPADVLLTNYVGVLEQARGQGLLTAVTSSKVQDIPAEFRACLYVLADFGAVAILRYSTFTRAVYVQMTGRYDLTGAAALSLVLVGLSLMFFLAERYCRRRGRFF